MLHMKKYISIFVLVSLVVQVNAQSHGFQAYPNKGKIKTIDIVKLDGEQEKSVDFTEFDKNGKVIYSRKHDHSYHPNIEKSVFEEDKIITYKCNCLSTDDLEKKFKPIGFIDYTESRGGSGTGASEQPRVEISKTDDRGNVIETFYYFQTGYIQSYAKMQYDKDNRLIKKESFDAYQKLFYSENRTYDQKGNLTIKTSRFSADPFEVINHYAYDKNNEVIESSSGNGQKQMSHYKYFKEKQGNMEFHYTINLLKNDTTKNREVEFNQLGQEVKRSSFQYDGTLHEVVNTEYHKSGRRAKETFLKADGSVTREVQFADDKLGNCIEITHYISTTFIPTKGEKKTEIVPNIYRQKITHF